MESIEITSCSKCGAMIQQIGNVGVRPVETHQEDVFLLLQALGLNTAARPKSCRWIVLNEILPAIHDLIQIKKENTMNEIEPTKFLVKVRKEVMDYIEIEATTISEASDKAMKVEGVVAILDPFEWGYLK